MEHDPQPFYERKDDDGETASQAAKSPEQYPSNAESPTSNPEVKSSSPNFEELVHQALEEELKYERDPNLRNQASQRADQILAEFAEAKNAQEKAGNLPEQTEQNNKLTPELAQQLGINNTRQPRPAPRGTSANLGALDLAMAIIITVLLIIVILLLIF